MKKTEIVKLFMVIRVEHSNFEITEEKKILWHDSLKEFTFEKAYANLLLHFKESEYPPKIANIVRQNDQVGFYDIHRKTTENFLKDRDELKELLEANPKLALMIGKNTYEW